MPKPAVGLFGASLNRLLSALGICWALFTETTPAAPLLTKPCHERPIEEWRDKSYCSDLLDKNILVTNGPEVSSVLRAPTQSHWRWEGRGNQINGHCSWKKASLGLFPTTDLTQPQHWAGPKKYPLHKKLIERICVKIGVFVSTLWMHYPVLYPHGSGGRKSSLFCICS